MAHRPSHLLSLLKIIEFPSSPNLSFKLCASSPIPYRWIFYTFISALECPSKTAKNRGRLLLYMENEDGEAVSHNPISDLLSNKTLTILMTTSLGLGSGFLYTRSSQTVKPISTTIKVSKAALKASKSLTRISCLQIPHQNQFSGRPSLFLKVSNENFFRRIHTLQLQPFAQHQEDKSLPWRGQLGQVYAFSAHCRNWVLKTSNKLLKNFMKVLKGFLGTQLDSTARNCVEVVELFVKTATVTREVSRIVDWTGWKERPKLGEIDGDCSDVAKNTTCRFSRKGDDRFVRE